MRQGVTLGISSRGVGSLKKVGERNEVQDDFELICFDLVSSPSTPGAYLFSNPEDRNKYEENLDEEKNRKEPNQFVDKSVDLMKKLKKKNLLKVILLPMLKQRSLKSMKDLPMIGE